MDRRDFLGHLGRTTAGLLGAAALGRARLARGAQASGERPPNLDRDPSEQYDVAKRNAKAIADLGAEVERHKATLEPVASQLDVPLKRKPQGGTR